MGCWPTMGDDLRAPNGCRVTQRRFTRWGRTSAAGALSCGWCGRCCAGGLSCAAVCRGGARSSCRVQCGRVTTVLLVRHAEKVPLGQDPPLSEEGRERARTLVHVLGKANIASVYVTQWKRTQQTAVPLCNHLGLAFRVVNTDNVSELVEQATENYVGKVILIVGHSNTVPGIIEAISGVSMPVIPENEYDNLYVVTVPRVGKAKILNLKYGEPS